ncbi:MAG: hypothetical protein AAFY71_04810 [Bacteroidota bacterium]
MEETLQDQFVAKLEQKYGEWNKITSRFGSTTFGSISMDLSISSSQFSKLISGTATEGMYQRSINNINRLIELETIRKELAYTKEELAGKDSNLKQSHIPAWAIALGTFIMGGLIVYVLTSTPHSPESPIDPSLTHPLSNFFDKDFTATFNSPYLGLEEVQDFCPGSAFEGSWSLSEPYKLPIPGSGKPGLYYYGKSADVRMNCSRNDILGIGLGRTLNAYEYLVNEIWVDTKMTPLSPTYFNKEKKVFTEAFDQLTFEENPSFKKVATIYSFFIDQFEIYPDSIVRKGEPVGRYATDIDEELTQTFEIDLKYILNQVLGNFTSTRCMATENLFCDPNTLTEKESVMEFDCLYTINTENLGIGGGYPYKKGYRLEKQNYSDNLTCGCD